MTDSIKQLIDDMLKKAAEQRKQLGINTDTYYDNFAHRLEALIGEPAAWITAAPEDECSAIPNRTKRDVKNATREYTIPLYRLDGGHKE